MSLLKSHFWPTVLSLLLSALFFRYILAPLILETITKIRIRSVSFRSIRGIQWKGKGEGAPQMRIERLGWESSKKEGAWFTILVEGLSLTITKKKEERVDEEGKKEGDDSGLGIGRASSPRPSRHSRQFSFVGPDSMVSTSPSDIRSWIKARLRQYLLLMTTLAVRQSPWLAHLFNLKFIDCEVLYIQDGIPLLCKLQELRFGVAITLSNDPEANDEDRNNASGIPGDTSKGGSYFPLGSPSLSPFSNASSLPASPFSEGNSPSPFSAPQYSPFGNSIGSDGLLKPPSSGLPQFGRMRTPSAVLKREIGGLSKLKRTRLGRLLNRALGRAAGKGTVTISLGGISIDHVQDRKNNNTNRPKSIFNSITSTSPERERKDKILVMDAGTQLKGSIQFGRHLYLSRNTIELDLGVAPVSCWASNIQKVASGMGGGSEKNEKGVEQAPWTKREKTMRKRLVGAALGSCKLRLAMFEAKMDLDEATPMPQLTFRLTDLDIERKPVSVCDNEVLRGIYGSSADATAGKYGIAFEANLRHTALEYINGGSNDSSAGKSQARRLVNLDEISFAGVSTFSPGQQDELRTMPVDELMLRVIQTSLNVQGLALDLEIGAIKTVMNTVSRLNKQVSGSSTSKRPRRTILLPRLICSWNLGHMQVKIHQESAHDLVPTLRLDGVHGGFTTSYREIFARTRDRPSAIKALRKEESLFAAGSETTDGMQPEKRFPTPPAELQDSMSFAMNIKGYCHIEPISLTGMPRQSSKGLASPAKTLRLDAIQIGADVTILGSGDEQTVPRDLSLRSTLGSVSGDMGRGVEIHLTDSQTTATLTNLLATISALRSPNPKGKAPASGRSLFTKLPAGLATNFYVGDFILILTSRDFNPSCPVKLWRGIKLSTKLSFEYCYYSNSTQTRRSRHSISGAERQKLGLEEGCAPQALALENRIRANGGHAAVFTYQCDGLALESVHDGEGAEGAWARPTSPPSTEPPTSTRPRKDSFVGWSFQKFRDDLKAKDAATAESPDPYHSVLREEVRKPILVVPSFSGKHFIQQESEDADVAHQLSARIPPVVVNVNMAHIYCGLLAAEAVKAIHPPKAPGNRSPAAVQQKSKFSLSVHSERLHLNAALPLGERVFLACRTMTVAVGEGTSRIAVDSTIAWIPSPVSRSRWEEILRIKTLSVQTNTERKPVQVHVAAEGWRFRVPFGYEVSKLTLNVVTSVKAFKLLRRDLTQPGFPLVRRPAAEGPKSIPHLTFDLKRFSVDIKDDPVEAKLNLIWRVGLKEQADRLERQAAFEAKATAVAAAEGLEIETHGPAQSRDRWHFDSKHSISIEEAQSRLMQYDSIQWRRRFDNAHAEQNRREFRMVSRVYAARPEDRQVPIDILPPARVAPLFRFTMDHLHLEAKNFTLDRDATMRHMERLAGPYPAATEFSLMVPLHLLFQSDSLECTLRDYPLPLLRVPPRGGPHDVKSPAFAFETDIVFGEELPKDASYFLIPCVVLPESVGDSRCAALELRIAKTAMPTKTFAAPMIRINTPHPTDFTWGNSYRFGIHDLTKCFETFTHPPRDPSPKVGFWDKFRLVLHWQVTIDFTNSCHLHLKGSRDPYLITQAGAGFVLAWEGPVKMTVGVSNEQNETIQVHSEKMILSVPDLTAYTDTAATGTVEELDLERRESGTLPKLLDRRGNKTCAKFANGSRVGFRFKLERTCLLRNCKEGCSGDPSERNCRFWNFKPHHEVLLVTKERHATESERLGYTVDSYEGFRSDFVHFSMSLTTLGRRVEEGESSNFHFTPHGFAHFFNWWRLFNRAMGLPIRQGKLFPTSPPPSRKFGRSLGTIKYRFDIAPLFISHVYPQQHASDWTNGQVTAVGMKARIGHFRADAHQREVERVSRNERLDRYVTVKHKPFYAAEVFMDNMHLRALLATFDDADKLLVSTSDAGQPGSHRKVPVGTRVSELSETDARWYEFDDYVDTDNRPPGDDPHIDLHDIAACPRLHYSKWVPTRKMSRDVVEQLRSGSLPKGTTEASKFGKEGTHDCLLKNADAAADTQRSVVFQRLETLYKELKDLEDLPSVSADCDDKASDRKRISLRARIRILEEHVENIKEYLRHPEYTVDALDTSEGDLDHREGMREREGAAFENVYHIHQPRITLNNQSRNIVLKYYYSNRYRKGFEYHMSNAALRLLAEQLQSAEENPKRSKRRLSLLPEPGRPPKVEWMAEKSTNALAQGLLKLLVPESDSKDRQASEEASAASAIPPTGSLDGELDPYAGLPDAYTVDKSHYLMLMGPQISLVSEADQDSRVLLAATIATFRGFTVKDPEILSSDVNATVMHRSYASLIGLQSFYPASAMEVSGFEGSFVPLEIALDVKSELPDFDRIISRADAKLRYDKFNQLRLKHNLRGRDASESSDHIGNTQDLCVVEIPRFAVMANGRHYSALYNVVTDLMLYQDPEHREFSEVLEAYSYAFDVQDRQRVFDQVALVQARIRDLQGLIQGYEEAYETLTIEAKTELEMIKQDFLGAAEQLKMMFQITAAARSQMQAAKADLLLSTRLEAHAGEIAWFMLNDDGALIAKLAIKGIAFSWTRKKDSSTENVMVVQDLQALNSDPNAHYTEMVSRFVKGSWGSSSKKAAFAHASWSVLAPVGGITIIQRFDLHLHPVKIALEKKIGKQLMDYVFNDRKARAQDEAAAGRKSLEHTPDSHDQLSTDASGAHELKAWKLARSRSFNGSKASLLNPGESSSPALSRQNSNGELSAINLAAVPFKSGRKKEHHHHDLAHRPGRGEEREMMARASTNRTFVAINIESTVLVLSYKGEKSRSLTDLHDLKFDTPSLQYNDKTWSFETLVAQMKKDYIKAAWGQRGQLVKGFLSRGKSQSDNGPSHIAPMMARQDTLPPGPSALRFSVQAPSPQEEEVAAFRRDMSTSKAVDNQGSSVESSRESSPAKDADTPSKRRIGKLWQKLVSSHADERNGEEEQEGSDSGSIARMRSNNSSMRRTESQGSLSKMQSRQLSRARQEGG